jgi:hypothetical protein
MREAQVLKRHAAPAGVAIVRTAGARAHAALARSGGLTLPVPGFEATGFRLAAGELVWVGHAAPLHPRVALLGSGTPGDRLDLEAANVHASGALPRLGPHRENARNAASMAILRLISACEPRGFATLITGRRPAFPLNHRADAALAAAAACERDDAAAFANAAARLLGSGAGLTPSGDDFVGGALFARRLLGMNEGWQCAASRIVSLAPARSHAISSILLGDMAAGSSYAVLHDLAAALAASEGPEARSIDTPMRELVTIGHSSGWEMLSGFIAGLAGQLDFSRN